MLIEIRKQTGKMFKAENEDLENLLWVSRVLENHHPTTQYHVCHILIDGKNAIGTDGARMHIAELNCKYKPGMYRVFAEEKTHIILLKSEHDPRHVYPDISILTSKFNGNIAPSCYGLDFRGTNNVAGPIAVLHKNTNCTPFDLKFILDLDGFFDAYFIGEEEPIMFKSEKKTAYIMPMRV